jgi:hypothetical protein
MSPYGFGHSSQSEKIQLPMVSRVEPLASDNVPLSPPRVLNPLFVNQDKPTFGLFKHVIHPLTADKAIDLHSADKNVANISQQSPVLLTVDNPDRDILVPVQVLLADPAIPPDINCSAILPDMGSNVNNRDGSNVNNRDQRPPPRDFLAYFLPATSLSRRTDAFPAKAPDKRILRPTLCATASRAHAPTPTKEASNGYYAPPWSDVIAF